MNVRWLVYLSVVCVGWSVAASDPLPDGEVVIRRLLARAEALAKAEQGPEFTYEKRVVIEELDRQGRTVKSEERIYEGRWVAGLPLDRLVKIQGRSLTDAELRHEAQREERLRQKFAGVDIKKKLAQKEAWVTSQLAERFEFETQERLILHGRPTLAVSFRPKPGKLPSQTTADRLINQLAGMVWVDEADTDVVKFSISLLAPVSFGWFGILGAIHRAEVMSERQRMPEAVWLPTRQSLLVEGRLAFHPFRFRVTERTDQFQLVATER